MSFEFWYYVICIPLLFVIYILVEFLESHTYYDLNVDGEDIKNCHCKFHNVLGYLEIENPETKRVIIVRFDYYSIQNSYFRWRKNG